MLCALTLNVLQVGRAEYEVAAAQELEDYKSVRQNCTVAVQAGSEREEGVVVHVKVGCAASIKSAVAKIELWLAQFALVRHGKRGTSSGKGRVGGPKQYGHLTRDAQSAVSWLFNRFAILSVVASTDNASAVFACRSVLAIQISVPECSCLTLITSQSPPPHCHLC